MAQRIDGVKVKKLKVIPDERGRLMEILRNDEPDFEKFGQVYMTTTYPGVVKGWHYHKKQTDNICCVLGMIKVALYDGRQDSPTNGEVNEFYIGTYDPCVVTVPNGVFHGWKCVGDREAIIINTVTEVYNYNEPDEFRTDPHDNDIPYCWDHQDK